MSAHVNWQKSSFSGADNSPDRVEPADADGQILIRESAAPGAVLTTGRDQLHTFLQRVKAGEFDHLAG